jgi:hypothetical protein
VIVAAVDPGLNCSGLAVGTAGELLRAEYVEVDADGDLVARVAAMSRAIAVRIWSTACGVSDLVVEWPRVLAATHQRGSKRGADSNDLLAVAGVASGVAALVAYSSVEAVQTGTSRCRVHSVHPDAWKGGQVPKDVMGRRVLVRLTEAERARLALRSRGGLDHNMVDAVGIYLHHVGRLGRKRVMR